MPGSRSTGCSAPPAGPAGRRSCQSVTKSGCGGNPLRLEHLQDFIASFNAANRSARAESERFHRFGYDELIARDKASLDITWLKDDSLEDTDNLPPPEVIAQEIVEDLEAALAQFTAVAQSLARGAPETPAPG